jgi:hypothetical protein
MEVTKLEVYPDTFLTVYTLPGKVCIDRGNPDDRTLKGIYVPTWLLGRLIPFISRPRLGVRLKLQGSRHLGTERLRSAETRKVEGYTFKIYRDGHPTSHWVHVPKNKLKALVEILRKVADAEDICYTE